MSERDEELIQRIAKAMEAVRWPCHCDWRYGQSGQSVTDLLSECRGEGVVNREFTGDEMLTRLARAVVEELQRAPKDLPLVRFRESDK